LRIAPTLPPGVSFGEGGHPEIDPTAVQVPAEVPAEITLPPFKEVRVGEGVLEIVL
jgi:hypothetical protein